MSHVFHATEGNTARANADALDGYQDNPQEEWDTSMTKEEFDDQDNPLDEWDTSMTKEEFDETVKAAEIAEKKYGGTELREYKILAQAKSPRTIRAIIRTLESGVSDVSKLKQESSSQDQNEASIHVEQPPPKLQEKISQFVSSHEFFKHLEKGTTLTTLQRRRFTRDLYDYSRALGLSSDQADFQVTLARTDYRRRQGYENDDDKDTGTEFGEEVDDSKELITEVQKKPGRSFEDIAEASEKLAGQGHVENKGGIKGGSEKNKRRMKGDLVENSPTKISGSQAQSGDISPKAEHAVNASSARKSPRTKRKRDTEDDSEDSRSSVNPNGNGVIDKQARKAAKKQRMAAAKLAKQTAAREGRGPTGDASVKGESKSSNNTPHVDAPALPSEPDSKSRKKRKRKEPDSTDQKSAEISGPMAAGEPLKEDLPSTTEPNKKKRKRKAKEVVAGSKNPESESGEAENLGAPRSINRVSNTGADMKRIRSRGPRARAANAGLGRGNPTENPFNTTPAEAEASKQPKAKTQGKRKHIPEVETVSCKPVNHEKAAKEDRSRLLDGMESVDLLDGNSPPKPMGTSSLDPVGEPSPEALGELDKKKQDRKQAKKRRRKESMLANKAAQLKHTSKPSDGNRSGPEQSSPDRGSRSSVAFVAGGAGVLLDAINAVQNTEADSTPKHVDNTLLPSTSKDKLVKTNTDGPKRKARSRHDSNGHIGKNKLAVASEEGKAHHL